MLSRLGNGFKSNQALLRQTSKQHTSMSSNSSRISLFQTGRSKSRLQGPQKAPQKESSFQMMQRLIINIEKVLQQYPDLSMIIKGQLNSIIRLGKNIIKCNKKTEHVCKDKQNISINNFRRDVSQQKLVIMDRLKNQSQIQKLMQKLIKSKQKRVKLADENFELKSIVQECYKRQSKLRKVIENQKQLIQSCLKEIDKLKEKTPDSEWDEDLLSMITLQAEQLEKALRSNNLKTSIQ